MAQKLPLLKQSVKTMKCLIYSNTCIVLLSFTQFRPYSTTFPGLLSSTLMSKSKKTGETN